MTATEETISRLSSGPPHNALESKDHFNLELQKTPSSSSNAEEPPHPPRPSAPRLAMLFFGLFLGSFLASLDISIIATALPRIASDFNAQTEMSWIATAYILAYTALQLVYGRVSDIFGRRPMYMFACIIFLIGSIGCGVANSMTMLILFRAVQGIGGSGLFSLVMIIIADMFSDIEERAKYMTVVWVSFAVSSVAGPLLGGVFVEHATWRWCFYINLPLVTISFVLIAWLLRLPSQSVSDPESKPESDCEFHQQQQQKKRTNVSEKLSRIDYLGVVFVVAAVVCLLLALTWGGTAYPWNSGRIIALFCAFVVLIVSLMWIESRAQEPVIPPNLFLNRGLALVLLVAGLTGFVFMGCTYYIPLYFQVVQGVSTTTSGVRLMPSVLGVVVSTTISSLLMKRFKDIRYFIQAGLLIMTTGNGLLILFGTDTSVGQQVGFVLILGFGQGLIFQNCIFACQELAEKKDLAVATSLCGFVNAIGSAVGVAVCAATLNNGLLRNLAKLPQALQEIVRAADAIENMTAVATLPENVKVSVIKAYADSFRFLFTILTPIIGLALLASLLIRKKKDV